jgi:hypothetical protein
MLTDYQQFLDPKIIGAVVALVIVFWVEERFRRRWLAFARLLTVMS